jgi:hypothetical protein
MIADPNNRPLSSDDRWVARLVCELFPLMADREPASLGILIDMTKTLVVLDLFFDTPGDDPGLAVLAFDKKGLRVLVATLEAAAGYLEDGDDGI